MRNFAPWKGFVPGIGGTVSAGIVPRELTNRYRRVEPGFSLFFRSGLPVTSCRCEQWIRRP